MQKLSDEIDPHLLSNLDTKAYWALDALTTDIKDRFSSAEISEYLVENAEISVSRQAIDSTLGKTKGTTNKNKFGYKLMKEGRNQLLQSLNSDGTVLIEAGKPFSAKKKLREIFDNSLKTVDICDPYLDLNSLDVIFKTFHKNSGIRILTAKIIDKPSGSFNRHLEELIKEGYKIEVRVYKNSELHDRYIIADDTLWFSGNSLNYLGVKESFMFKAGDDTRQTMLATFNGRWKIASPA